MCVCVCVYVTYGLRQTSSPSVCITVTGRKTRKLFIYEYIVLYRVCVRARVWLYFVAVVDSNQCCVVLCVVFNVTFTVSVLASCT